MMVLQDYQKALILNEDCESQYALDFLLDTFNEMNSMPQRLTEGDRRLLRQFRGNIMGFVIRVATTCRQDLSA